MYMACSVPTGSNPSPKFRWPGLATACLAAGGIALLFGQAAVAVAPESDGVRAEKPATGETVTPPKSETVRGNEETDQVESLQPGHGNVVGGVLVRTVDPQLDVDSGFGENLEAVRVIYDDQSLQRRSAVEGSAEAYVYKNDYDTGSGLYLNYFPDTGSLFPGTMMADEMILGNGFDTSKNKISGYEALIYRSTLDPTNGVTLANYTLELWDGDPFAAVDALGGGDRGTPIASATFTGVPGPIVALLRAELDPPVSVPNQVVWMVLSGDQTCRTGWRISGRIPEVGSIFMDSSDLAELQEDYDGQLSGAGHCCGDLGDPCVVPGDPCEGDETGSRYFCTDLDAEDAYAFYFGGPCVGGLDDFCASFVGNIYAPSDFTVTLQPRKASGPHTIDGNEIKMWSGGQIVWLDIMVHNWGLDIPPATVKTWQAQIDSSGYTSGLQGALAPWNPPCVWDTDCQAAHEHVLSGVCNNPGYPPGGCSPGFQDFALDPYCPDPAQGCLRLDLNATAISTPDFMYGSTLIFSPPAQDNGVPHYAGTVVLEVSPDAQGTFTVGFNVGNTWLKDYPSSNLIPMLAHVPALITVQCFVSSPPEPDTLDLPFDPISQKVRYLSFKGGDVGKSQAVRVTFHDIPAPYNTWNGVRLYVQKPQVYCENAGVSQQATCPPEVGGLPKVDFWGATLGCTPYVTEWAQYDVVHVFHEGIIPHGVYDLQLTEVGCMLLPGWEDDPDAWSPLTPESRWTQSGWGDAVSDCTTCTCGPPDGSASIGDVTAVLEKWKNLPCNLTKARADMEGSPAGDPRVPDQAVNITDVTYVLGAFLGESYPPQGFPPPSPPPDCP